MRKTVHLTFAALAVGVASPALADEADWQQVEKALGVSGSMESGDVYKVGLPRRDLQVTADGVQIKPSFALGSWLAFKQAGSAVSSGNFSAAALADDLLTRGEARQCAA
jgi:hypothetical protein